MTASVATDLEGKNYDVWSKRRVLRIVDSSGFWCLFVCEAVKA